jgi:hypothetical protein
VYFYELQIKKLLAIIGLFWALLGSAFASVPCVAISVAGSGTKDGLSWTNAKAAFPGTGPTFTFVRGTRYYLADGTGYPAIDFTQAASGALTIELRKAQPYDFGRTADGCSNDISTGFSAATMASGQAIWSGSSTYFGHFFYLETTNFVLNGNGQQTAAGCGGSVGSNPALSPATPQDCGIKIDDTASCAGEVISDIANSGLNFTATYIDVLGCGNATTEQFMFRTGSSAGGPSISHVYMHFYGSVCMTVDGNSGTTVANSYFWRNQITLGASPAHGQCIQDDSGTTNGVVTANVFRDLSGTAAVAVFGSTGTSSGWQIYDNVVWKTAGYSPAFPPSDGIVACINSHICNSMNFSQNTITGMTGNVSIENEVSGTWTVQNNLWYSNSGAPTYGPSGTTTQDHNSVLASGTSCPAGTANVCNNAAANPFTSSSTGDSTLALDSSDVNNRAPLSAPYTADILGFTFATDRGAYQFGTPGASALPQLWVNNNECNTNYTYTLTFPGTWVSSAPAGWPTTLPYANTAAGVQQAILDMETYRTANGTGTRMHIPAGFLFSAANGPYIPQTSTVAATQCNVIDSTHDANLPVGRTVGSHGIQDNLATSTDIGLHNPSGDGLNMYDELGPQTIAGIITGITTLSSHTTTLAAITLNASPQLVALKNGYVSPGNSYVVDTGVNAETVVGVSGANKTGLFGVFTKNHASGVSVTYDVGTITLANGSVVTTASYNDVQHMWTVESTTANGSALRFCSPVGGQTTSQPSPACGSGTLAPDHWLIADMEDRPQATFTFGSTPTPVLMTGSGSETTFSQFPQHIHFRKLFVHSDWTSLNSGLNPIGNLLYLNGSYVSLLDTQASQAIRAGAEGHVLLMQGGGPYKIVHDWLEGQSIGMFSGGPGGTLPIGLQQIFQDVEARRNRETRPFSWLGGGLASNPHFAGQSTVFKNLNEIKNGQRILHDGFIWEGMDGSGGQSGPAGDVTDRNCSAATACANYLTIVTDVILSNGIQRNTCQGMEFDRSNLTVGNGNGIAYGVYRSTLRNLLTYGISGHNPGCAVQNNRGIALSNGSKTQFQGTIVGNGTTATFTANCVVQQAGCPGRIASIAVNSTGTGCAANGNLTFSAPNIAGGVQATGTHTCTGGALSTVTLTAAGSGYTSAPTATPATGTGTLTITMVGSPVPPAIGAQALDVLVGDPIAVTLCNGIPAFNNVTTANFSGNIIPTQRGPLVTVASTPWNGTPSVPGYLTVSFPSTVVGTDSGGFCTLSTLQGGPYNFTLQHMTQITDNGGPALSSNDAPSNGFNFQMNAGILDSIMLGGSGWLGGSVTEGTQTENLNYDSTTMSAHHLVWPTRAAANYTEYGNNALYPDAAGCTGAGCHNPVTMYFPATTYCTGASATSGCVGFTGAMSLPSGPMPITLPDYHNFALHSSSLFKSGGTQQASDGTDMGANIPAIDAAQTLNQYLCATACGSGPYPDVPAAGTIAPTSPFVIIGRGAILNDLWENLGDDDTHAGGCNDYECHDLVTIGRPTFPGRSDSSYVEIGRKK